MSKDEVYTTLVPSFVTTKVSGGVTVTRKLYGATTPELNLVEAMGAQRQADSLNPAKFEKPREIDWREGHEDI